MENQFILAPGVTGEVGGMPTGPPQRGLTVNVRNYTSRNFSEGFCYMQNGPSGEFNLVNVPVGSNVVLRYGPRVVRPTGVSGVIKFDAGPHRKVIVAFDVKDTDGAANNFDVKGYNSDRPLEHIVRDYNLGDGQWLWHDRGCHLQRDLPSDSFRIGGGLRADVYMSESGTSCVLQVSIYEQG